MAASVVPVGARAPQASCASPTYVAALGWACPVPGGYQVLLGDGTTVLSHGGDPIPRFSEGRRKLKVEGKQPSCVTNPNTAFHVQLVYVSPSDQPSRYSKNIGQIRRMARLANGVLYADARRLGRARSLRMACSGREPTVRELRLSVPNADQDFAQVVTEMRRAGFTSPLAKYWVYYDGRPPDAPAGTGSFKDDANLRASNQSNFGPGYAVTWGIPVEYGGSGVMLHELGHTLGAVQLSAPNSSGAAHCNDGPDVMCYDDGGPTSRYRSNACSTVRFDCHNNDYFHPRPKSKNYLHDSWNVASPWNRFLAGCLYRTEQLNVDPNHLVAGLQQQRVTLDVGSRFAIPKRCRNRPFALSAVHVPLPEIVYDTLGVIPEAIDPGPHRIYSQIVPSNVDICFFRSSKPLTCFAVAESEEGFVPRTATHAQITLAGWIDGLAVLNID